MQAQRQSSDAAQAKPANGQLRIWLSAMPGHIYILANVQSLKFFALDQYLDL